VAIVWIPAPLRGMTGGQERIEVAAPTPREAIDALDLLFPGIRDRLLANGTLRPGLALAINSQVTRTGLDLPLGEASEVHFLPAIGGGEATSSSSCPAAVPSSATAGPAAEYW